MTDDIKVPDGYSFVKTISSGGFGSVVEMISNEDNEHYAGKLIQCITPKDRERIAREVNRLRKFCCDWIVGLKEVASMDNSKVIVMELGEQSLADIVKDHTSRGVLVAREVCDLGAAESEDESCTRSVMSQLYVSPERMESETGRATSSSDVWALGIVLHWLLFGEPPFKSESLLRLGQEISSFRVSQIGTSCGGEERALLMRMLDPNPETRVTSCQLCSFGVFRCLVNTPSALWRLNESSDKHLLAERETWKEELKSLHDQNIRLEKELAELKSRQVQPAPQSAPPATPPKPAPTPPHDQQTLGTGGQTHLGAAAIELFDQTSWTVSGNVFSKSNNKQASLLSFEFGRVVARLSLTIRKGPNDSYVVGVISSSWSKKALTRYFPDVKGGAGWNLHPEARYAEKNNIITNRGSACLGGKEGQRVVLEADGREGKRTLKLSQDGETQPVFFTNIPVPFRFAVHIFKKNDSVEIESVEVVSSPQMIGGTTLVRMEE
ncbi:hypothetical protein BLNAU_15297 [Blattamonas nauphoetae]|uniref:Protein kinase domain-containing protein n=1 Tax=Blattamonas nauphoetae TaxID=2049346 RepID=A0ABQ9XB66_9EUKA|nr:hypothetical protein BLNAU_15297 [Blattamonas nauphoetae]